MLRQLLSKKIEELNGVGSFIIEMMSYFIFSEFYYLNIFKIIANFKNLYQEKENFFASQVKRVINYRLIYVKSFFVL